MNNRMRLVNYIHDINLVIDEDRGFKEPSEEWKELREQSLTQYLPADEVEELIAAWEGYRQLDRQRRGK